MSDDKPRKFPHTPAFNRLRLGNQIEAIRHPELHPVGAGDMAAVAVEMDLRSVIEQRDTLVEIISGYIRFGASPQTKAVIDALLRKAGLL